jgi:hypothetical protein
MKQVQLSAAATFHTPAPSANGRRNGSRKFSMAAEATLGRVLINLSGSDQARLMSAYAPESGAKAGIAAGLSRADIVEKLVVAAAARS